MTGDRPPREHDRDQRGADADRGAQPSETDGVDVQAVFGDRGEQRDRAAEEDREEVE